MAKCRNHGSVYGQGGAGSAVWRQDRAGDRGKAPTASKPSQLIEATG